MSKLRKLVALGSAIAMLFAASPSDLHARGNYSDIGGCGYEDSFRAPCIAPAVALGTIAIVAIIAVAVQNSNCSSAHGHAHSGCGCN